MQHWQLSTRLTLCHVTEDGKFRSSHYEHPRYGVCIVSVFQTVLRIWDCLFYEGSKIIFRVCLTLVKRNQVSILQCKDFSSLAECFKEITRDSLVMECHDFMQVIVLLVCCISPTVSCLCVSSLITFEPFN
jgi:hypothetical protein